MRKCVSLGMTSSWNLVMVKEAEARFPGVACSEKEQLKSGDSGYS